MMRSFLLLIFILFLKITNAQTFGNSLALPYLQNEAYKNNPKSVAAITNNIASLARFQNGAVGIYIENRFMLKALQNRGAIVVLPTLKGNFALQFQNAGFANFSENQVQLNYAKNLGKKVQVGIGFSYNTYKIPVYGMANAIGASLGLQYKITDKLIASFQAVNPMNIYINKKNNEKLSSIYKFGTGFQASEELLIGIHFEHQANVGTRINGAATYQFAKQFFASLGYTSQPNNAGGYFGGIGYQYKKIKIDAAIQTHTFLGISPTIFLQFDLEKRNKESKSL